VGEEADLLTPVWLYINTSIFNLSSLHGHLINIRKRWSSLFEVVLKLTV